MPRQAIRVLLRCDPPLLQEVMTLALGDLPGIQLTLPGESGVHVVVVSAPGLTLDYLTSSPDAPPWPLVVTVDPETNAIRVSRTGASGADVDIQGGLVKLAEFLWSLDGPAAGTEPEGRESG